MEIIITGAVCLAIGIIAGLFIEANNGLIARIRKAKDLF